MQNCKYSITLNQLQTGLRQSCELLKNIWFVPCIWKISKHIISYSLQWILLNKSIYRRYSLRLQLFSHDIARSSAPEDHHRALAVCIRQVPPNWKRPAGRPSHTWLHAIEADLGPLNFGLTTALRKATTRDEWQHIVDTTMLQWSTL